MLIPHLTNLLFRYRVAALLLFLFATLFFFSAALQTKVDAGFNKRLPAGHEYIETFLQYSSEFGGANRILIAFSTPRPEGIFTPRYFELLRQATDEAASVPGVEPASVTSIWTPNVRFIEIVEDGFAGGNVIPADFTGSPEDLLTVRENIIKSGRLGQLVANDFSSAVISLQLQEIDPASGESLDYIAVAGHLQKHFRQKFERAGQSLDLTVNIIGFAQIMGAVAEGASNVFLFFLLSLLITAIFVYLYAQSFRLTLLSLGTALVAIVWQLGLLKVAGYGIDPMSILVPFLILAMSVSHGVQMVRSFRAAFFEGHTSLDAARLSFRQLLVPGATALITDLVGFVTILAIPIPIIRELAVTAGLGVLTLFFTNLCLLPLLLSWVRLRDDLRQRIARRHARTDRFWRSMAFTANPRFAILILGISLILALVGLRDARKVQIGDLHHGVPELRESSRYNRDSAHITQKFNIGVSLITVITETTPDGCVDFAVMETIDRFAWHMENVPGVQSVIALPKLAKRIHSGWNEGAPAWLVLPRHPAVLGQAIASIDTSSGLLNADCSVMPVYIFLQDHRAQTISRVTNAVKDFRQQENSPKVRFRLATGNVGVMGATNEVVAKAQFPMLAYVFASVTALCLLAFRSWWAAFCIVTPLALVSLLAYSLMYHFEIGLVVSTLPVVALGVGVGVDYGIYLFFRLQHQRQQGLPFNEALATALQQTGSAVLFTGLTLACGVSTWFFSDLQFQADMGLLLTFMFFFNMLGALLILPALARWR